MNDFLAKARVLFHRSDPGSYRVTTALFLRALGVIYYSAFFSLWVQVRGLIGANGILPVDDLMREAGAHLSGFARWHLLPTLCWISSSDPWLLWQCGLGTLLSLALIIGILPRVCCILLWILWLSLTMVGRDFLGFQWENLLLESGFLAIFLAPIAWTVDGKEPSRAVIWLFRWLFFRLMFLSGMVKLLSADPSWRNFTALFYHYETQPLPTVFGWYAYQLPTWFLVLQTGVMYLVELVFPFLIFAGRRARIVASIGFAALQISIAMTGNYCYFNFLSLALGLFLLDDVTLRSLLPTRWRTRVEAAAKNNAQIAEVAVAQDVADERTTFPVLTPHPDPLPSKARGDFYGLVTRLRQIGFGAVAAVILIVSLAETTTSLEVPGEWIGAIGPLYSFVAPFRSINIYGLFAVMTKERPEVIIEGSNDGTEWKPYEFKYKPGDLGRRPRFVAPHQPRLDWQMWFAALSSYQQNTWFINFCVRLLEGKGDVLALLGKNPFPDKPPKFIRALTYNYEFTNRETLRKTGEWWRRTYKGIYMRPVSLNPSENAGATPPPRLPE
ncbi:MAG TPA: lipase maturation factor family protein [Verrucomicrobiae bacterium]|nr:lipase maturation factor family protein [Verrucomicrobiae bacterium]